MRWFVRGDIDGFFGLALDNLVQLLLIDSLCRIVLGFPGELIYQSILPGAAVSLVVGNLFYAWQARQLSRRTGRTDVCALPYGINTVSLIAYVFLVMLPAKMLALSNGMSPEDASRFAWQAGLVACLGSGLIELFGALIAQPLRRVTPRAALLSTLAGIAVGFIAMTFFFRTFARPIVGLTTLGIILLTYFGGVRFKGGLPGGLVAVIVGTAIAWMIGLAPTQGVTLQEPQFLPPVWVFGDILAAFENGLFTQYLTIILPMGLFNVIGSLQNVESASAAGDDFATRPALAVNGVGTIAASCFGSCFPTTIYIGHPAWKAMGARAGYSILNAVFFTIVCLTGVLSYIAWAIPIDAGMAIVVYIGIVITAQAFQSTPTRHAPAVVLGLLPGLAAWGTLMSKTSLKVTGYGLPDKPFSDTQALEPVFQNFDLWVTGAYSLSEGFILTSVILSAVAVAVIDRKFRVGAVWCFAGAGLTLIGMMHSWKYEKVDVAIDLSFAAAWRHAVGYIIVGGFLLLAPWITEPGDEHSPIQKE